MARWRAIVPAMKRRLEAREGTVLTTVALPAELHKALAIAALEEGSTSAECIRVAVATWLKERRKARQAGK